VECQPLLSTGRLLDSVSAFIRTKPTQQAALMQNTEHTLQPSMLVSGTRNTSLIFG